MTILNRDQIKPLIEQHGRIARLNNALRQGGDVDIITLGNGDLVAVHRAPEKLTDAEKAEIAKILDRETARRKAQADRKAATAAATQPTQPTTN